MSDRAVGEGAARSPATERIEGSLDHSGQQDSITVRRLRRGIGVVGLALPVVLIVGNLVVSGRLLGSISASYHSELRDVFVGAMCAIGSFLVAYRYAKPDDKWSTAAGVLAVVVALFHTTDERVAQVTAADKVVRGVHVVAAAALFLVMAYFCIALFTKQHRPTPQKLRRNTVYRICGWVIIASVGLALASNLLPYATRDSIKPLLWCETIAVLAFGLAWMVKGETIFKDSRGDS
jgi:hypothetical protein